MKRLLALAAVLAASSPALAVQTVGAGGTHATIPDALAVAAPGEEIHVRNDHQEFLTVIVTQDQSIVSYDATFTNKVAGAEMLGGLDINMSSNPTVTVDGCTMTGPGGRVNVGLFAGAGTIRFANCTVTGLDHGITLFQDGTGTQIDVENSQVVNNEFHAFQVLASCSLSLVGTEVNQAGFDGILLGSDAVPGPSTIMLDDSTITNAGFGVILDAPTNFTMLNASAINGNRVTGLDVRPNANGSVLTLNDSSLSANASLGFYINSPLQADFVNMQVSGNTFEGGIFAPGSSGTVATMTDSVMEANGQHGQFGDGLRVDGDVTLDLLRTDIVNGASTEGDGVFCLGGAALADITITECNIDNNGRNGFNTDAFLSTLSITNSSFDGNRDGCGISVNINANGLDFGTVTDSSFSNNAIEGVQLLRAANGVFEDCDMSGNGFAGIARFIPNVADPGADPGIASNLTLRRCTILGNGERAVTLSDSNINATIEDCTLENGTLGALHSNNANGNTIEFDVRRTVFEDTQGGPAFLVDVTDGGGAATVLTNCVFDGNGTMLTFANAQATVDHCTIASAPSEAVLGVAVDATSNVTLTRSIVDGPATGVSVAAGGVLTEQENIINGSLSGFTLDPTSLNGVDPMFATPSTGVGTGDFHLLGASPAVGLASLGVNEDITMGPRPLPAAASMADSGAYEVDEGSSVGDWSAHTW